MATPEEDFAVIDGSLKRLQHEYDLFFAGASKLPPAKLRSELDRRAKSLGNARIESFALRFKVQALLTRYSSKTTLWDKQMRLRESGIRDPRLASAVRSGLKELQEMDVGGPDALRELKEKEAAAAAAQAAATGKPPAPGKTPAAKPAAAAKGAPDPMASVFEQYAKLKQETGEKLGTDLAKFSAMLQKKQAEFTERGVKNVTFVPAIKDGKVILKAKTGSG